LYSTSPTKSTTIHVIELMKTPEPVLDLDLIAAFIDGRLTPRERERAVKLLTESDAAFEIFADALRVQADLGDQAAPGDRKVVPISAASRTRRLRSWSVVVPLAAAAVLMIAVLPMMRANRGESAFAVAAEVIAGPLTQRSNLRMALGEGWEQRSWSVTRGGASPLAQPALAFRLGVRTVDLQVALAMEDRPLADRLTAEIQSLLEPVQFSQMVAADYAELRTKIGGAESRVRLLDDASQTEGDLGEFLDPFWFGFGKWCGGGELAARAHSGAFFESDVTAQFIDEAIKGGKLAGDDVATLRQIYELRQGVAGDEFDTLRDLFRTLIKRHGG